MKVTLDIPDREWARLVTAAEAHGVRVADLVRDGVRRAVPAEWSAAERIVRLVVEGLPDAVIAERLGVAKQYVGRVRRRAGRPPNRFDRSAWAGEFKRDAAVAAGRRVRDDG